jgi:hypothetical protein
MGGRRRRGLADLIGEVGAAPQEHAGEGTEAAPETREEAREGWPRGGEEATAQERSRDEAAMPAAPKVPPRVPKYLALERKEARLRGDQVDSLASLARRVNRQKPSRGGERITENLRVLRGVRTDPVDGLHLVTSPPHCKPRGLQCGEPATNENRSPG